MNPVPRHRPEAHQRFPFIHLGKALDRAKELYKIANSHEVPFGTAAKAWTYAEKSSGAAQTAAALKAFGLLQDVTGGDVRRVKLTDTATRIIRDPRDISPDRDALIREAALKPVLFGQIVQKYSGMPPSDEALKAFLMIDKGIKDEAIPDLMRSFAATMALAKISERPIIQEIQEKDEAGTQDMDSGTSQSTEVIPPSSSERRHVANIAVPEPQFHTAHRRELVGEREWLRGLLSRDVGYRLLVSGDLGAEEVSKLIKILEAQKAILSDADYLPGSWHFIDFTSDMADLEVARLASALHKQFIASGMPKDCEARRHLAADGSQTIFLSPAASALASKIPAYEVKMHSCRFPDGIENQPSIKVMTIFD
jgi:hypothetical protein